MKLKAAVPWTLVLATLLILGSCDAMFQGNLFKAAGLGQVQLDDISTAADAKDAAGSPSFYAALEGDSAAKAEIILLLETEGGTDSLALAALIELETSPAMAVADAFVGELPGIVETLDLAGEVDLGAILAAVLPADIALGAPTPPAAFVDIIDGFLAAAAHFAGLAAGLGPGETIEDTPYMAAGDVAYFALVSLAIGAVVPQAPFVDVAGGLWAAINGTPAAVTLDEDEIDPSVPGSDIADIFTAAGLDLAALFG